MLLINFMIIYSLYKVLLYIHVYNIERVLYMMVC